MKKLGPHKHKVITSITHSNFGHNGWEPFITVNYDMGEGFRLAKDMNIRDTHIETAVKQKYIQR